MSLGDGAEMIFWETPELREKLYPYLDLGSLVHLAECHNLTREIDQEDLSRGCGDTWLPGRT